MASLVDRMLKSEDFLAIVIILVATLSALALTYTEVGESDFIFAIGIPLALLLILVVSYEVFKALLRVVGRETERGKKEVQLRDLGLKSVDRFLVICPKCKARNAEGAKFCNECGEKI